MAYNGYEDLRVWQKSKALAVQVFVVLKNSKEYKLKEQMTKAALSIPSNIAEGYERKSSKEFIKFLGYSKGSASELKTQIQIAKETGIIKEKTANEIINELNTINSMIAGLIKSNKKTQ
ncbi:MAG: four helix bundle protein [Candidatus Marinimicrobia bacterium]|nr:four helix bundle protein [Candidatus Neomarinimicrobiota bacterium]